MQQDSKKDELANSIVEHNEGITKEEFEIKHSYKSGRERNWIIEVEPTILEKLPTKKLKIG